MPIALGGISMDSGTSLSEKGVLGGCSTVVYSHSDSCTEFRKAASSRILTSETTDSVFRIVAMCRAQRPRLVMGKKIHTVTPQHIELSPSRVPLWGQGEVNPRFERIAEPSEDCRQRPEQQKRTIAQLILPCLFEEQHHLAAYDQSRFHIQRVLEIRSPLISNEHTTILE